MAIQVKVALESALYSPYLSSTTSADFIFSYFNKHILDKYYLFI